MTEIKKLTVNENNLLQSMTNDREICRLETELIKKDIYSKQILLETFKLKMTLLERELIDDKTQLSQKHLQQEGLKKGYSEFIKKLQRKYSLPDKWGINSDTREITGI